jgi:hypothetical protein
VSTLSASACVACAPPGWTNKCRYFQMQFDPSTSIFNFIAAKAHI